MAGNVEPKLHGRIEMSNKRYVVTDWANNVMDWGTFNTYRDAHEEVDARIRKEIMWDHNIDIDNHLLDDNLVDELVADYRGEYFINEVNLATNEQE